MASGKIRIYFDGVTTNRKRLVETPVTGDYPSTIVTPERSGWLYADFIPNGTGGAPPGAAIRKYLGTTWYTINSNSGSENVNVSFGLGIVCNGGTSYSVNGYRAKINYVDLWY